MLVRFEKFISYFFVLVCALNCLFAGAIFLDELMRRRPTPFSELGWDIEVIESLLVGFVVTWLFSIVAGIVQSVVSKVPRPKIDGEMYCIECRYNLKGLNTFRCPECGTSFNPRDMVVYRTPRPLLLPRLLWISKVWVVCVSVMVFVFLLWLLPSI
jgi:hypothetical protein